MTVDYCCCSWPPRVAPRSRFPALPVSCWMPLTEAADFGGGFGGALGQLARLIGHHGKSRAVSPARAASIAFSASRIGLLQSPDQLHDADDRPALCDKPSTLCLAALITSNAVQVAGNAIQRRAVVIRIRRQRLRRPPFSSFMARQLGEQAEDHHSASRQNADWPSPPANSTRAMACRAVCSYCWLACRPANSFSISCYARRHAMPHCPPMHQCLVLFHCHPKHELPISDRVKCLWINCSCCPQCQRPAGIQNALDPWRCK